MTLNHDKTSFLNPGIIYIVSGSGETPIEKMNDCLRRLDGELRQRIIDPARVIRQTVFFEAHNSKEYNYKTGEFRQAIGEFYRSRPPSTSFIAQVPEADGEISLEAYVAGNNSGEIEIAHKTVDDIPYTTITTPYYKEVYAAGLSALRQDDLYEQAYGSFSMAQKILDREKLSFADIVRQWNYIEKITHTFGNDIVKQNYQVFNDVRSSFYGTAGFLNGYPSATGIGTVTGGVTIEFIAVTPGYFSIHPIKNPGQTDAHKYSEKVLVGEGVLEKAGKTTPKFERGKLLKVNNNRGRIYVSGTAAVLGEASAHKKNVEKQTLTTIENINKLLSPANLSVFNVGCDVREKTFSYIRTYVKHRADIKRVKTICEENFKSENFQYLISDICRDNLLVEIEGSVNF